MTDTAPIPSFSATDNAPAAEGSIPVATTTSYPRAASVTAATWLATARAARSGNDDGPGAATVNSRADTPTGTKATPTSPNRPAKSGGAHTRTWAPPSRNRTANATNGSTSPRDP
ncbi:hypothetical protein GCM10010483_53590 [Actinokineospora diospyrosa]